ncbi:MAG: hypothetical protein P4L74_01110 [Candidatus Doudnabacteria bacterium]|nr:hypothetical protein [Candidatus Doudnabacteria bacterium]
MRLKILGSLLFVLAFIAAPVYAAETIQPSPGNPNVIVGGSESHKNLYVAGGQVTVNSDTKGDLTAAGGMVNITGNVEQEALVAGGNLNVSGSIGGTMRIAGGNITINGPVGGDLVSVGGSINISGKSKVSGDLMLAGGNIVVDAPVMGNIKIAGGSVTINSPVSGSVQVTAKQLIFGPGAQISGNISYKGQTAAVVDPAAKISQINFTRLPVKNFGTSAAGLLTLAFLIKLLAWMIAAWVFIHFRKNFVTRLNAEFRLKPWENLGIGFLALVAVPAAVIILFITFVGYYLAFLLGLAYLLTLAAAALLSSIVLGYFLLDKMKKPGEVSPDWQAVIIGVVIWMLLSFIPILGWLAMTVWFLMILGAGVKLLKRSNN